MQEPYVAHCDCQQICPCASNISGGNLKLGLVVDEGTSDEQADALERIFSGKEGGMFGEFAPLVGEWLGVECGFAPTFTLGRSSGSSGVLGIDSTPATARPPSSSTAELDHVSR